MSIVSHVAGIFPWRQKPNGLFLESESVPESGWRGWLSEVDQPLQFCPEPVGLSFGQEAKVADLYLQTIMQQQASAVEAPLDAGDPIHRHIMPGLSSVKNHDPFRTQNRIGLAPGANSAPEEIKTNSAHCHEKNRAGPSRCSNQEPAKPTKDIDACFPTRTHDFWE
jgi:hypothetical protein